MRLKNINYTNSEMSEVIEENIHSQRDRLILRKCFIDGLSHEKISEEINMSNRQVSNIISKYSVMLIEYLRKDGLNGC
jgi:DNA-directed RNA polymerase specialized sigma subunit